MRRTLLRPPRAIGGEVAWPANGPAADAPAPPARGKLAAPEPARRRRRPLFHPKRGWFRRLERRLSNRLALSIYPRLAGLHRIYDRQLKRDLTLSDAEVGIAGLPAAFDGLRILLISDVHAGPLVSPATLLSTFQRLLTLEPDLVLLGGDLTTCRVEEFETHREAFRTLRAPLGVFAVLGNHDYYSRQADELRQLVAEAGIPVLHNRSVALRRGGQQLQLAGVDDLLLGEPDLKAAVSGTAGPVVLLSHNPDLLFDAVRENVALVLSGHTHGGQIRIPGLPVIVRQSRYRLDQGRYRAGDTELLVSRGLGVVGAPWRIACPPEAVLVRLVSKPV